MGRLWQVVSGLKEVRDRIASVKNTQKITDAMKLVAAAKVRRAQEAVINGRPFTENLVKVRPHTAARGNALGWDAVGSADAASGGSWVLNGLAGRLCRCSTA